MKKLLFLIFLLIFLTVFIYSDKWFDVKHNDVVISLPENTELIESSGTNNYIIQNDTRAIIFTIVENGKIKFESGAPIYIGINNLEELKDFYIKFTKGGLENFENKFKKVEIIDTSIKNYKNIKIYDSKININDGMIFETRTFFLDDVIYSLQYLDFTKNNENKIEKDKIFNSIKFNNSKTLKNQFNNKKSKPIINYYKLGELLGRLSFYFFGGVILLIVIIFILIKRKKN